MRKKEIVAKIENMQLKKLFTSLFLALVGSLNGQNLSASLEVTDADGVFHNQDYIQAFVDIQNTSNQDISYSTEWNILTDDWTPLKTVSFNHSISSESSQRTDCPLYRFNKPGFYRIQVKVTSPLNESIILEHVVGFDPEKIVKPMDEIPDFDLFWKNALSDLAKIDPSFKISKIKRAKEAKTNLFEVEMLSYQGVKVRGWLEVPKKKGVYPAVLRVPGYQETMEPIDHSDDLIVFSFNTRDHGNSDDSPSGNRNWDMWVRDFDSKDKYYYKGLFLDCIRALDFLETRSDIDQSKIAIWGGSQGGGLAFSTSALDQRIALCIADIPYMCDYPEYFEITYWKEVTTWFSEHPETNWDKVFESLSYYDMKNFAGRIKCPVWMGIGLQDDVCPPSTSFVAFNNVESEKSFVVYKNENHNQPPIHYTTRFDELRRYFGLIR